MSFDGATCYDHLLAVLVALAVGVEGGGDAGYMVCRQFLPCGCHSGASEKRKIEGLSELSTGARD